MFHLFFSRRKLHVCLLGCCICFTHMFASVLFGYCICFTMVFMCFCKCCRCMFQVFHLLQVLHLDVSKLDEVFHLPPRFLMPRLGVSSSFPASSGHLSPPPPLLDASVVRSSRGPAWCAKWRGKQLQARASERPIRLDV
jgi:hypothetical protein